MKKVNFSAVFILFFLIISCNSSTEPESNSNQGLSASSFSFKVGNEWIYAGKGYDASNNQMPKSISTINLKVLSQTNSNGLNGFKVNYNSEDFVGNMNFFEFFVSTDNDGLWTLENLPNGTTSPVKLLPFSMNSSIVRSETKIEQIPFYDRSSMPPWPVEYYENIQLTTNVNFEYLGIENVSIASGDYNDCKKIKVTFDLFQKSDTSGFVLFDGQTLSAETIWWLSDNNGLIKTETDFHTVIDSVTYGYWDFNTGTIKYYSEDILNQGFRFVSFLYHLDAEDFMIQFSPPYAPKLRSDGSLKYLGKYITELSSKNF